MSESNSYELPMIFTLLLKKVFGESDIIARIDQNKFVVLVTSGQENSAEKLLYDFKISIRAANKKAGEKEQVDFEAEILTLLANRVEESNLLNIAEDYLN